MQDNSESPLSARSARRRAVSEIGYQSEWTLTAIRLIACRMAYRKILLVADHGRATIALAIPMATLLSR
jgi:hypothetical protein